MHKKFNYISLFSGAGVGCHGFKMTDFECIATCELLEERIEIQKINKKCFYNSGYITGDLNNTKIKERIYKEIKKWSNIYSEIDVIVATPPCQGMSTANYKKNDETERNSLVLEAIKIIKKIQPKVFVFENVKSFLKTICSNEKNEIQTIERAIENILSKEYNIYSKIINFKDYGVPSSRPRTIVIGTRRDLKNISPLNIFSLKKDVISLRESIGNMPSIKKMGFIMENDIFHFFRSYPNYVRDWISPLKEGESSFSLKKTKPYKIVNGEKVPLKSGHMGNKFRRTYWDRPSPCITTRNDQLASQNTIHPNDDRVFSISELEKIMTIDDNFKWVNYDKNYLNALTVEKKIKFLKQHELKIRRVIGEAVPTKIFYDIAKNIKDLLEFEIFVNNNYLETKNADTENFYINSYIFEKNLIDNKSTGSFYTTQSIIFESIQKLKTNKKEINILEPSVGAGNFIPQILQIFDDCEKINITLIDIDEKVISFVKKNLKNLKFKKDKINFEFVNSDFLNYEMKKFDFIIGNPPYYKIKNSKKYFTKEKNIFSAFLEKILNFFDELIFIIPKNFLMADSYYDLRKKYEIYFPYYIVDFGISAFKKVFIEIISVHFTKSKNLTFIKNYKKNEIFQLEEKYIYHEKIWLIYRNNWFDSFFSELIINSFDVYRDRSLTNKYLKNDGKFRVLRSKNITDQGDIIDIKKYDKYIDDLSYAGSKKFINQLVFIMPNFTYNTRLALLPKNTVVNGSIAILIPKNNFFMKKKWNFDFFSTKEFREYYRIIKNDSKFTLNVDKCSTYYIGYKK